MAVRAKFRVSQIESAPDGGTHITLHAVYDPAPGNPNHQWWKLTPAGGIQLHTVNAAAAEQFTAGAEYFVDFTPADEA